MLAIFCICRLVFVLVTMDERFVCIWLRDTGGKRASWKLIYILRNCRDYECGVSFFGNVLGTRREKKGRTVCSTISRALRAAMSPGYVTWYTERSLSRRCISRDAARPGHLTYKMVSVFQLSHDKLWNMGANTKQPVDYNVSSLQRFQECYRFLLRYSLCSSPFSRGAKYRMLTEARTNKFHIFI